MEKTMVKAINQTLDSELSHNDKLLVFGEDVATEGGVCRATQQLHEKYPHRVFDTPLAEAAILGLAFGLGVKGYTVAPEIQFEGFTLEAMDSLVGQIARYRYRMAGTRHLSMTIRAAFGGGVGTPEMHSDSIEGLFAQVPGLRVVIPSSPYEAKGLLLSALRCPDPVFFAEHMRLYRSVKEEVPSDDYELHWITPMLCRRGVM